MKTDRNEAITKNDQFLIICSRGGNGVLLRNAQIGILQHSVISTGLRKQALLLDSDTIKTKGCQAELLWLLSYEA